MVDVPSKPRGPAEWLASKGISDRLNLGLDQTPYAKILADLQHSNSALAALKNQIALFPALSAQKAMDDFKGLASLRPYTQALSDSLAWIKQSHFPASAVAEFATTPNLQSVWANWPDNTNVAAAYGKAMELNWPSTTAARLIAKSSLRSIAEALDTTDFSALMERAREQVTVDLAGQDVPVSAATLAQTVSIANIQEIAAAVGDAVRESLRDNGKSGDQDEWFDLKILPVILCVLSIILQPLFAQWLTDRSAATNQGPVTAIAPGASATSGFYVVMSDDAVLRTGPDTQQRYVTRITRDDIVRLVKRQGQWSFVIHGTHAGWIKTKYLRTLESVASSIVSLKLLQESAQHETSAADDKVPREH